MHIQIPEVYAINGTPAKACELRCTDCYLPFGARIVAVADAFEMLVRDRPHRGARAFAVAG